MKKQLLLQNINYVRNNGIMFEITETPAIYSKTPPNKTKELMNNYKYCFIVNGIIVGYMLT